MNQSATARNAGPKHVIPSVWQGVRKHWATALATMLLVTAAATFFTLNQKKIYEAQATIQFDPNPPRPLGSSVEAVVDMGTNTYWNNQEYYETQYKVIQSHRVASEVVKELGLQNDAGFLLNLPAGAERPRRHEKEKEEITAELLRSRLEVVPVRDSRLAVVKLQDADPDRAQEILNALVNKYVELNLDNARQSTGTANDWLRGRLGELKTDLEASELALYKYRAEKDILSVAFEDKSNMLREQMAQINKELTDVRAVQQHAAARKAVLDSVPSNEVTKIWSSELLNSGVLTSLRERHEAALAERDALTGEGMGPKHPEVAAASRRVERAEKAILNEITNVKESVTNDLAVVSRRVGGLSGMLAEAKKKALELNLLEIEHNRLQRSKDNTEKLYSLVLERLKESDLTLMLKVNNIQVLDRPLIPREAVSPRVPLNVAVGLAIGLLLGVAASFLRALLDQTIKVPDDIEQELGATFLGILPVFGNDPRPYPERRKRGRIVPNSSRTELLVHDDPTSAAAEAARAIRTNLIFMAPDNPYKCLLITSGGPQEGKTTVTSSIAIAMAQANQRVLLLDCDLRRPRIHRVFGLPSDTGVTSALLDENYDAAICETEVPNLSVMPCGPPPPNPAELFHSGRFKKMIEHLRGKFDRVIIDSPPVVAVTDAAILATLADGTVMVTRAFSTRKELAWHALRTIQDVGGKLAGVVLNAVEYRYAGSYYYYRHNPSHGRDTREQDRKREQEAAFPAASN